MPFLPHPYRRALVATFWTRLLGVLAAVLLAEPSEAKPHCCDRSWLHTRDCRRMGQAPPQTAPDLGPPPETLRQSPYQSPEVTEPGDTPPGEVPVQPETPGETYPHLTHNGQIQFQFDQGTLGSPRSTLAFPASGALGPFPAADHLFVRRFRPAFNLAFNRDFALQTEFNIDPRNERIQLLDARLNLDLSESTYLSAGRFKVPFGWEGLRSSRSTNTVERSDMTLALYPERDVGLAVTHRQTHLGQFSLGSFLGQARSNGDSNGQFDLLGRALFHVDQQLNVGFSGHTGTFRPTGSNSDLPVRRIGTEMQYSSGPWQVEAEAMWSNGYNTYSRGDTPAMGYYAAVVYRLPGSFDLVLNYDRFDPDTSASNALEPDNSSNARDRKVVGLNYYLDRDRMHRFMVNYEWKQELEGPRLHTQGWRVRYQLAW